ncbi:hypothetical protein, conserved [Perkinsus marinus ATCC 50983]|uniref:tRNA:m(4)X modification enzyme TRM13 n=1 Tax=Perkinsus marinus (strain ATCC 50983 / TXsc) TaxID=423536 RepID=C5L7L8_PERM5|nr:hypothetical protein, conserved [Perkinsus marinus ATCC 50983]EER07480.1 hypothetical protein, conserved [Perkinsus marinus ATCC 50983]|eukprot:XP_002775664.1 hypothetical protein, conserved [Perkinsus marinus ATCC 50983]
MSKVQRLDDDTADVKTALKRMSRKQRREALRKQREGAKAKGDEVVHCDFWVAAKHRYCKFQPAKGSTKCSVHQDDAEGDKKRVPCPIDPNHTVYERNLEKHIAVCSKTKDNDFIKRQPLYDEGYNIPEGKRPDPTLDGVSITNGDNEDEDAVRKLTDELRKDSTTERIDIDGKREYRSSLSMVVVKAGSHVGLWSIENNNKEKKLVEQEHRNLGGVERTEDLQAPPPKASVTGQICVVPCAYRLFRTFLLVDREARRNKQENRRDLTNNTSTSSMVMRLRMDIADLNLTDLFIAEKRDQKQQQQEGTTVSSTAHIGYDERLENLWSRNVTVIFPTICIDSNMLSSSL